MGGLTEWKWTKGSTALAFVVVDPTGQSQGRDEGKDESREGEVVLVRVGEELQVLDQEVKTQDDRLERFSRRRSGRRGPKCRLRRRSRRQKASDDGVRGRRRVGGVDEVGPHVGRGRTRGGGGETDGEDALDRLEVARGGVLLLPLDDLALEPQEVVEGDDGGNDVHNAEGESGRERWKRSGVSRPVVERHDELGRTVPVECLDGSIFGQGRSDDGLRSSVGGEDPPGVVGAEEEEVEDVWSGREDGSGGDGGYLVQRSDNEFPVGREG